MTETKHIDKAQTHNTSTKIVEVAVGVLVRQSLDGPLVLITQRPDKGVLAGYWEFPGGGSWISMKAYRMPWYASFEKRWG